ncbi:MAG TPA: cytochrome c maturation protein CcmE [Gemmatimonadaceae bacterium]|jgi:cytochrome c-type biogenesis protein CcmE|nr:cytochrome c maturation protein CcmE [Gemmatimonadaceae bacterium]
MSKRNVAILVAVVLVATFGWLLYGGLNKNVVFFLTPKELVARGASAYDVPVRLGGQVKPGSVQWNAQTLKLQFEVIDDSDTVLVHETGAPPQMFQPGMGVVVEGRLGRDNVFKATNLMVKHSNEYHPPKPGEKPQELYKTLITGAAQ